MQTEITFKDFMLFLKKNIKLIITTSIIFLLVSILIGVFQEYRSSSRSEKVEQNEEIIIDDEELEHLYNTDPEELTSSEAELLNDYLLEDAYYFTVLIEEPDYSPYNRANLLNEFLLSDQVINQLEQEIGREILPSPEQAIQNSYNQSNVLHTFMFTTGNRDDNQVLANAVFNLIINKELSILENRHVFPKDVPNLVPLEVEDQDELMMGQPERTNDVTFIGIIVTGIISLILGLIFGVILSFIKDKFNDKIGYLHSYSTDKRDIVIRYNKGTDVTDDSVIHGIQTPANLEKVVIIESKNQIDKVDKIINDYSKIHLVSSISEIDSSRLIEEAVILVNIEQTTKKWLREQMNLLEIHDVRKKILIVDV